MRLIRSAKVLLSDQEGNILVLERSETHPRHPRYPDLPGGDIEVGEMIEEGLAREILEETGLAVESRDAVLVCAGTALLNGGDSISRLLYSILLDATQPLVTLSGEHSSYSWRPVAELKGFEEPFQEQIDYVLRHNLL